jgi:hypothetical protein
METRCFCGKLLVRVKNQNTGELFHEGKRCLSLGPPSKGKECELPSIVSGGCCAVRFELRWNRAQNNFLEVTRKVDVEQLN